jgi:NAD(P)H-hydrate epimerase
MTPVLLEAELTRRVDAAAIAAGTPGVVLMERAGASVAVEAVRRFPGARRILVLAGPGANGGDGFVAARRLADAGRSVRVALLGAPHALTGDAAVVASRWQGVLPLDEARPSEADLVVDALFGAGLSRPVDGAAADVLARVEAAGVPILAVDLPSGVDGDTGAVRGRTCAARATVAFVRRRPGHLLYPGRGLCGDVIVADIGIGDDLVATVGATTFANEPELWRQAFPRPAATGHKFTRGHALIVSGPVLSTGAARLAARGALRAGAGLVTVAGRRDALIVHAAHLTAIMLTEIDGAADLGRLLDQRRFAAVVLGPGAGVEAGTRAKAIETLQRHLPLVLDADGVSVFAGEVAGLADLVRGAGGPVVVTPHEGEFARLFRDVSEVPAAEPRLRRARAAAARLGAIVVLKGPDTIVAAPDGRASIAANAPAFLATAGAGDVLAGVVGGLLAQGMPAFEAACAGVWLHGEAARRFGAGLTADDLPDALRPVLAALEDSL